MPGKVHSWLYIRDRMGLSYELINAARTTAYLSNPDLAIPGISPCQPFEVGACETYPYQPYLGADIPGHVTIPGTTGNTLSVADTVALDIVGDLCITAHITPVSWTGSTQTIVGKWSTASNLSYLFQITSTGRLIFSWTTNGTSVANLTSAVMSGVTAGVDKHVGLVFDVNNGASGRTAWFWISDDGNNWTKIGLEQTSATATSIFSGTSPLLIGGQTSSTNLFNGKVHDVQVRSLTAAAPFKPTGTIAFETDGFDIIDAAATSYAAKSGQTVTVNRSGTPQTTLVAAVDCSTWVGLTFDEPSTDPAPWWNINYPQSGDALGFTVEEWTGLDDAHVTRPSSPWGGYGGGSSLRSISAAGRTMKVNVFLFGRTEEAVEYLFRWLGSTLAGVCSSCATDSIMIRRFCGSEDDLWDGVAELRNVGLVQGLTWEADVVQGGSCYLRRASFTLMAGDPCMYLPDEAVPTDPDDTTQTNLTACFAASVPDPDRVFCRPTCHETNVACRTTRSFEVDPMAAMAPIVTWENTMEQYAFPFRAITYADPGGIGPDNPCGLPILGEVYVRPLPPGASLRWDVVGRTVEVLTHESGGWAPGWGYIEANDQGERRFYALPCGRGHVVMEPASLCAEFVSGTTWRLDGINYNPPTYPTVTVRMGERVSCP